MHEDWNIGGWRVRLRPDSAELAPAYAFRAARFRSGAEDRDAFDAAALHLTVEGAAGLAAYARLFPQDGAEMARGYSAQAYDVTPLVARYRRAVEVGRVCLDDGAPDLPRLLLAVLARLVDRWEAELLWGCASFPGRVPPALGRLADRAAPWGPGRRAGVENADLPAAGAGAIPPMLRLYLAFGASVSGHAVVDRDLGTTHVLAMLPVREIPVARARLLRGMLAAA
ncbi:GNAT family N-acyltransferase [Jannaschia aquimarina]|uniref:Uncharacterized protein n=1 Tax=Jannaschia aquimarina TaxID=935700 RepID=A0A0D1CR09_9RHOB|nr:GNAT family N-acyltransferase [Jannaschia aquimarina]KIT17212.1 hypothetical protein jaqu_09430 [Jannaschia aquimarina]SNT18510.1 ornithine-acyl[acyl carrier protein] N-acyltransferase [Jannaschia aquimarina]